MYIYIYIEKLKINNIIINNTTIEYINSRFTSYTSYFNFLYYIKDLEESINYINHQLYCNNWH